MHQPTPPQALWTVSCLLNKTSELWGNQWVFLLFFLIRHMKVKSCYIIFHDLVISQIHYSSFHIISYHFISFHYCICYRCKPILCIHVTYHSWCSLKSLTNHKSRLFWLQIMNLKCGSILLKTRNYQKLRFPPRGPIKYAGEYMH